MLDVDIDIVEDNGKEGHAEKDRLRFEQCIVREDHLDAVDGMDGDRDTDTVESRDDTITGAANLEE